MVVERELVVRRVRSKRCALILWASRWAGRRQDRPWKVGSAAGTAAAAMQLKSGKKKKRVPLFGPTLQTLRPQVLIPDLELVNGRAEARQGPVRPYP